MCMMSAVNETWGLCAKLAISGLTSNFERHRWFQGWGWQGLPWSPQTEQPPPDILLWGCEPLWSSSTKPNPELGLQKTVWCHIVSHQAVRIFPAAESMEYLQCINPISETTFYNPELHCFLCARRIEWLSVWITQSPSLLDVTEQRTDSRAVCVLCAAQFAFCSSLFLFLIHDEMENLQPLVWDGRVCTQGGVWYFLHSQQKLKDWSRGPWGSGLTCFPNVVQQARSFKFLHGKKLPKLRVWAAKRVRPPPLDPGSAPETRQFITIYSCVHEKLENKILYCKEFTHAEISGCQLFQRTIYRMILLGVTVSVRKTGEKVGPVVIRGLAPSEAGQGSSTHRRRHSHLRRLSISSTARYLCLRNMSCDFLCVRKSEGSCRSEWSWVKLAHREK